MKKFFLITMLMAFGFMANAQTPHWTPVLGSPDNMNTLGQVFLNGTALTTTNYEVGAFVGAECRGAVLLQEMPTGSGTFKALQTILGEDGQTVTFKLYDHNLNLEVVSGTVTPATLTFHHDDFLNPYDINFTSCLITAAANNNTYGSVNTAAQYVAAGTSVTLTATPATGYDFVNWTKGGSVVSTNATYTFTASESGDYVANFEVHVEHYTITATCDPTGAATITGAGSYADGATCTLSVTAINPGYTFLMWTKNGSMVSENLSFDFTVTENAAYEAKFSSETYIINAFPVPSYGGTATVNKSGFAPGETCTLTATANASYYFVNWTDDTDTEVSTDNPYSFPVTAGGNYFANFNYTPNSYVITASCNPTDAGTVTGAGTYAEGATCTLTATANTGSTFLFWTKDGSTFSGNDTETISFTVTADAEYVANFSQETYLITATASPSEAGTVTGAGGYTYNQECTLEATANAGYLFYKWTKDGSDVSTDNPYVFNVTEAGDYVAEFVGGFVVTVTSTGGSGTITGAGTYGDGDVVTLTATADAGSTFLFWMDGTNIIEDNPYVFTVHSDKDITAYFSTETYIITAVANPSEAGTVTGAGGYTYNQTCTLTATANDGYLFSEWKKDGTSVSTDNPYSFNVTEAGNYEAIFEDGCLITVTCNPAGAGTLTGDGTYAVGATVTLSATANPGSTFLFWTLNGTIVSEDPTFSFTATTDAEYVANYTVETYIISATASPSEAGTVTGGGGFTYGQSCTLTATANEGYVFVNWTLNGSEVATTPSYTFNVTESGDYVANFVIGYNITAECEPASAGVITGTGVYTYGQTCTLSVVPVNSHFTFAFWTKNGVIVSDTESFSFTVTEDAHYVANFTYDTFIISVFAEPSYAGEVTGGGGFMWGETCTLTATANTGYNFVKWTKDGLDFAGNTANPYTFTVTEGGNYEAVFEDGIAYNIYTMANPAEAGETTGDGYYNDGASCTISATANEGYTFVNWTLNGVVVSTDATYTFTVSEEALYVANFSQDLYYVSVDITPATGGYVNGVFPGGYFLYGHLCVLEAVPYEGYSFLNWTKDGVVVSTEPIYRFVVTADTDMVAHFTQDGYVISASVNPYEAGTITGTGNYIYGQSCTLTVTPEPGYTFINWTKDGEQVSTSTSYTFTVTGSANYVANFSQNLYSITVEANPADAAYVFVQNAQNGQFTYGQICTIRVATPNPGYTFVNWTLNGVQVSTEMSYSFIVTGNAHFVANFDIEVLTVTATAVPSVGGIVSGDGLYDYGTSCTLTATPRNGYTFLRWTKDGIVVSTNPSYTFTVREDGDYVAQFTNRAVYINAVAMRDGGQVFGAGVYEEGETVTLSVIPDEGYIFDSWTENEKIVSLESTFSFIAMEDHNFVAILRDITDVNENGSMTVTVYPNPVTSELTVNTNSSEYQVNIYSITGALIRTMNNCSNTTRINVEDLPCGVYVIRLTDGNNVETSRFIKQ